MGQNLTHAPQQTPLLFDHFVGAKQDRWRHGKAERLGGLEVHDHLKFRRKLHREIARLLAAQDAIHISGGAAIVVYRVGSIGEQTALSDKARPGIDGRYVVPGRRRYDHGPSARRDDKAASRLAPKGRDGRFDLSVAVNGRNDWHDLE